MGVKYAILQPNIYTSISARPNAAELVSFFQSALLEATWTSSSISGGYQLTSNNPQGLSVKVNIKDLGDAHVGLQMIGASTTGFQHKVAWEPTIANNIPPYGYQIHANPSGFFISRPGVTSDPDGSAFMCGIPYIAGNCGVGADPTEVWYAFGDFGNNAFFANMNPRIAIDVGQLSGFLLGSQEANFNGTIYSFSNWSAPQILRMSTTQIGLGAVLWNDGSDFAYEAIVAWPLTNGGDMQFRGQIYNAVVRSSAVPKDSPRSFDGFNWFSYTDNYSQGTLWLLKGKTIITPNYAY